MSRRPAKKPLRKKGARRMVVTPKEELLQKALEGRETLVLRSGGRHPKRTARFREYLKRNFFDPGSGPDVFELKKRTSKYSRGLLPNSRIFLKELSVPQESVLKIVTALKSHGFLAEEPVFSRREARKTASYRVGHSFSELTAYPRKFREIATPENAKKAAEMLALVWKTGFTHGHPHEGNIVYFKGKLGLIDFKYLEQHCIDWSDARQLVRGRFSHDLYFFNRFLILLMRTNPAAWPDSRRQIREVWKHFASKLPMKKEERKIFFDHALRYFLDIQGIYWPF